MGRVVDFVFTNFYLVLWIFFTREKAMYNKVLREINVESENSPLN